MVGVTSEGKQPAILRDADTSRPRMGRTMRAMHEIELKFQIPDASLDTVLAAVRHLPDQAPTQRLQAAYFDTADRKLARARAALRVRQASRRGERSSCSIRSWRSERKKIASCRRRC